MLLSCPQSTILLVSSIIVVNSKRSIFFLLSFLLKLRTNGRKCKIWTHDYNVTVQYLLSFTRKRDANTDHIVRFCSGLAGTLSPLLADDKLADYEGSILLHITIVYFSMKKEDLTSSAEEHSDQKTVSKVIRSFAKATTPKIPGCRRWVLPLPFFFACFGIKAQYFAPFGFTAFSNKIYKEKFGQTSAVASFLGGFKSLLAGLLSPFMGALSDRIGKRSLCLAMGSFLSVIGFGILAMSSSGKATVWVASVLFALQYGFGDTVAYISIRFIVGVSRSGIGYGIYGIFGNLIATLVPMIGGFLMETPNGTDKLLWYFTGLMGLGTLCWCLVLILEGPRSLLAGTSSRSRD